MFKAYSSDHIFDALFYEFIQLPLFYLKPTISAIILNLN